jgi:hypothetical protein
MSTYYLNTNYNLKEQFTPTIASRGEIRKAKVKNANLPFLQFMYHGNAETPLHCLLTGQPGWVHSKDYGTGEPKTRFRLDFNHIRQRCNDKRTAGESVDKENYDPSSLFRGNYLDPCYNGRGYQDPYRQIKREEDVFEFMCIMPICNEEHSFISQDSAKSDLVLTNFPKHTWSWCLQNSNNFEDTKEFLGIEYYKDVSYDFMIDHLSNINYDNIRERL